jgi:hypothetical protein
VQTVSYDFHTDNWAEAYGKRIDAMIAALKTNGVPVLWVGLPAIRQPEHIYCALYAGFRGLHRIVLIVDWRRGAG